MATLRDLREQRHLTREQLASAAEVSASTVYNAESGRVSPRPAILRRLARALNVGLDAIDPPVAAPAAAATEPPTRGGR